MPDDNLQTYGIQTSTGYLQQFKAVKPETTIRTNTAVIVQDPDLIVPIGPYQTLTWKCMLVWSGVSPGDAQAQFTTPAAIGLGGYHAKFYDNAVVLQDGIAGLVGGYNLAIPMLVNGGAGSIWMCLFEGYLVNGANGGYFSVDWAQVAGNAIGTELLKGSYLEAYVQ